VKKKEKGNILKELEEYSKEEKEKGAQRSLNFRKASKTSLAEKKI